MPHGAAFEQRPGHYRTMNQRPSICIVIIFIHFCSLCTSIVNNEGSLFTWQLVFGKFVYGLSKWLWIFYSNLGLFKQSEAIKQWSDHSKRSIKSIKWQSRFAANTWFVGWSTVWCTSYVDGLFILLIKLNIDDVLSYINSMEHIKTWNSSASRMTCDLWFSCGLPKLVSAKDRPEKPRCILK